MEAPCKTDKIINCDISTQENLLVNGRIDVSLFQLQRIGTGAAQR